MTEEENSSGSSGADRRQHRRHDIDYDLAVDIHGEHVPYTGIIKDISEGGLFIATVAHHKIGDVLQVRFTIPAVPAPVEVKAKVRWFRDEFTAGGNSIGVGVQFIDLPQDITRAINAYLRDKTPMMYEDGM